jgi:hypothetical protein
MGTGVNCGFIDNCNFDHNTTGATNGLGSIYNNCDFSYNQGGGCDNSKLNTFNNCTFTHNTNGLSGLNGSTLNTCLVRKNASGIVISNQSVVINNSTIDSNSVTGIDIGKVTNVTNCVIKHNGTGIYDHNNSSFACTITNNIISLNNTGLKLTLAGENISCNTICNNASYDLDYSGVNNVNVAHNYWCTADSASTQAVIYDGHDNINYGLAMFMPIDASCNFTTGIKDNSTSSLAIYPNPAVDELSISMSSVSEAHITIYDMLGNILQRSQGRQNAFHMNVSSFQPGVYLIFIESSGKKIQRKFVKS